MVIRDEQTVGLHWYAPAMEEVLDPFAVPGCLLGSELTQLTTNTLLQIGVVVVGGGGVAAAAAVVVAVVVVCCCCGLKVAGVAVAVCE